MSELFPSKRLGFGLMRLPKQNDIIQIDEVNELVDEFIAQGFTYFDTAYTYPGSEEAFGQAVAARHPREEFTIATKLAAWRLEDSFRPKDQFKESLERLQVEYIDYYLIHSIQPLHMPKILEYDVWGFVNKMKQAGLIRHLGFSYHGHEDLLEQTLTEHPETEFVQLQINYLDWENEIIRSRKNYEVCQRHGIPVIVMEPVKGGILNNLANESLELLSSLDSGTTPASLALRYAGSLDGVAMVLSGMNTPEQLRENMSIFEQFQELSESERVVLQEIRKQFFSVPIIECTSCGYCTQECPTGINIPEIFKCVNDLRLFGEHMRPHQYYDSLLDLQKSVRASECIACGACEEACPQQLTIIELLEEASSLLD